MQRFSKKITLTFMFGKLITRKRIKYHIIAFPHGATVARMYFDGCAGYCTTPFVQTERN